MIRTLSIAAAAAIAGYLVGRTAEDTDSRFSRPGVTGDDVSVREDIVAPDGDIPPRPHLNWEEFDEDGRIGQ